MSHKFQEAVQLVNLANEPITKAIVYGEQSWAGNNRICSIQLLCDDVEITDQADDFFESLCKVRNRLEALGLRPHCYGASENVYPSGMARDMGGGLRAYKLVIGKHAKTEDLVGIFDSGDDVRPVSVEQQRTFWKRWLIPSGIGLLLSRAFSGKLE